MNFDPTKTALLIVDLQNDNLTKGGKFEDSGAVEHAKKQNVVENIKVIAENARKIGIPVFHNHFVVEKDAKGIGNRAPIFRAIAETKSIVRGTWGAAPVEDVKPQEGDFVIEKSRMSAFNGTSLDTLLRGLGIETIIVTGVWTNMAVEHTCRDGADYGYNVVIATDGTSTVSEEWQEAALNYAMNNIATKMSTAEIIGNM
ncbi:Nicotinamidase-related amidase [Gracilibacillus ureilyticus]|uniref:Nicotinamidase-related amidase n=1 Tax=Gracilibacillus ureilyticus TaxID=531814 RepID=A0A1H9T9B7_9BACI|nr:cysteine hydrolase [Gracilibacillus ureilyticus]SER93534.1 Nicotinamidase-related amidase [Gracilibacillus ureilyticus]